MDFGQLANPFLEVAPNLLNSISAMRFRVPLSADDTGGVFAASALPNGVLMFRTYVPSRNGGVLEVGCDAPGTKVNLFHPRRTDRVLGADGTPLASAQRLRHVVKPGEFGWFYVGAAPVGTPTRFFVTFTEVGLAREADSEDSDPLVPWNFWYFPYAASRKEVSAWGSATLTPCQKYELAFGVSDVLSTEQSTHNDPAGTKAAWVGHCHNSAPASMIFKEPPAAGATFNGVKLNCEEIKFFAAEFFGRFGALDYFWGLPGTGSMGRNGPFQEKRPSDDPKLFGKEVPKFHDALFNTLAMGRKPCLIDLRDSNGAAHEEVWNQAVFRYEARIFETPGENDPKNVTVRTTLFGNEDTMPPDHTASSGAPATIVANGPKPGGLPKDTTPSSDAKRDQLLEYQLFYKDDGTVDAKHKGTRWSKCVVLANGKETFAPRFMFTPKKPNATADPSGDGNPKIARADVLLMLALRDRFK